MSLRKAFKTDATAEAEGVWVDVLYSETFKGPVAFKLARMSPQNKQYSTALERAWRPHEAAQRAGTLSTELSNAVFRQVFADTIVKDWRNVSKADLTGDDADENEQLSFNPENCRKLLETLPDLMQQLVEKANSVAAYTEAAQGEAAKN